ncbi:hypothetical protein BV882_20220 [Streptomyces sp. 46]|nr:hypothetical protein BV882_20220 [Streptomyces sp. 46]
MKRVRYRWRDEYESDPEYQRILARLELPWWKRPVVQVAVVASAAAFVVGALIGNAHEDTDTPSSSPSAQTQQDNQPAGLTYQQKQQILFKFCTSSQMRGAPGDSSAFPTCMASYEVTDQGMVMPK